MTQREEAAAREGCAARLFRTSVATHYMIAAQLACRRGRRLLSLIAPGTPWRGPTVRTRPPAGRGRRPPARRPAERPARPRRRISCAAETGRDDLIALRLAAEFVGPVPVARVTVRQLVRAARTAVLVATTCRRRAGPACSAGSGSCGTADTGHGAARRPPRRPRRRVCRGLGARLPVWREYRVAARCRRTGRNRARRRCGRGRGNGRRRRGRPGCSGPLWSATRPAASRPSSTGQVVVRQCGSGRPSGPARPGEWLLLDAGPSSGRPARLCPLDRVRPAGTVGATAADPGRRAPGTAGADAAAAIVELATRNASG